MKSQMFTGVQIQRFCNAWPMGPRWVGVTPL